MGQHPAHLTDAQRRAREAFDLEAALAALPADDSPAQTRDRSTAGVRLRPWLVADISDDLLREFARDTLKAARMSEGYLDALRVILGNQANAERLGYVLQLNVRTSFAPERTMRTILGQMRRAGITHGRLVTLGSGRSQVVQCFVSDERERSDAEAELNRMARRDEDAAPIPPARYPDPAPWGIPPEDVPY